MNARLRLSVVVLVSLVAATVSPTRGAHALGFNTGMLYRYPWDGGVSMTRTTGWGGSGTHSGDIFYAVDWDNASGNWLARAANGGGITCNRFGDSYQEGLGNYIGIFNAVSNQMSISAHLVSCGFFVPDVTYEGTQGQGLSLAGDTGTASGIHLHFHVVNGSDLTARHITVPFAMSDKDNFTGGGTDGPSDNIYVGDDGAGGLNPTIRSSYLSIGGGSSAAWWAIGATYRSINDNNDEFGGPCRNTTTAVVHLCGTDFGIGLLVVQNYIHYLKVRHSLLYTTASGGQVTVGHVKGGIQGALSNGYGAGAVSRIMGAPTGVESSGRQNFQGGFIQLTLPGVRQEVWRCNPSCFIAAITRFAGDGSFCPSVNGDGWVNLADVAVIDGAMGTSIVEYDLNGDGTVNALDRDLVISRLSTQPCPGDADGDGLPDADETGTFGTDPLKPDTDADGCGDGKEVFATFATPNPNNPWDFYSVPVPALFAAPDPTVVFKDNVVTGADAQAVFAYFKRAAKTGTQEYEQDLNLNGIRDGVEYDRTVVGSGTESGPPDGVIAGSDTQRAWAQAQHGYAC